MKRDVLGKRWVWGITVFALLVLFETSGHAEAGEGRALAMDGWTTVASVPLPGRATRFDYQSLDPVSGRLYLAHLGDDRLVVFDTKIQKVSADIPGFPNIHGVLVVPERGRIYATVSPKSRTKGGRLVVVDGASLRVIARLETGIHPDGLAYEPLSGRLFVSNEWGKSVSVYDAAKDVKIATIPLHGEVGNTQVDRLSHRVYATVQTRNLLVRIDPFALHVARTYRLPCRHPHGLVIDGKDREAYVACEGDDRLLAVDLGTGEIRSTLPTGRRPDVLSFDPSRGLLFVAAESGQVSVFKKSGKDLTRVSTTFLGTKAHSILVDPRTHRIYLPLENEKGRPVLKILSWRGP